MAKHANIYLEIKALRRQLATLEKKCQEREDKMTKVLMALEPFVEALTKAQQLELSDKLDSI